MKTIGPEFLVSNKGLLNHKKCVFVVGAGISVASGIPDFRSTTGIFATLRQQLKINGKQLFTYNFGIKEEGRKIYLKYISSLKKLCDGSKPNITHHFLANFPKSRVYTQNIDGLEEKTGMTFVKNDGTKGVYLHGNLSVLVCQYCGFKKNFGEEDIKNFENENEIICNECNERSKNSVLNGQRKRPIGVMHPGIIHYQQVHPDGAFISKMCEKDLDCDLLIVIGTSLAVEGVKKLVKMFCKNQITSGKRILVNLTKPNKEWENYFDYFYEGDCSEFAKTVETLVKMPKYGDSININDINQTDIGETVVEAKNIKGKNTINDESIINENNINDKNIVNEKDVDHDYTDKTAVKKTDIVEEGIDQANIIEDKIEENSPINEQFRRMSVTNDNILEPCTLDVEEIIDQPVINELIDNSIESEVHTSFCVDLQAEIENIVKSENDERLNNSKVNIVLTPKKKRSKKR